jgi:hypothetical protein
MKVKYMRRGCVSSKIYFTERLRDSNTYLFCKICASKFTYTIRMDSASRKKFSVKKATLVRDKLSQFSYTKKKDPKVPFGLGPDSAPLLSEILEDDKSLT